MSASDHYRRNVQLSSGKIAKLQADKSRLAARSADLQKKMNSANTTANKTNSVSMRESKLREANRAAKDLASVESQIAKIENDIASEQKRLNNAQQSLSREEETEARNRKRDHERLERRGLQQLAGIDTKLTEHDYLHMEAFHEIEKLQSLPERIIVLFLASNPLDQGQLRLDEEVRLIHKMIRQSEHRDAVKLESCWAVRTQDVMQAINEHDPRIVHFSGHGSDKDELVFQDDAGNTKLVTKEAISQTLRACSGDIQLVFFNTCYSRAHANEAVKHVPAAVGMNTSIGDDAARVFASQFYSAIGFGKSVGVAFEQRKAALMLEGIHEEDAPELFVADCNDPNMLFIVGPPPDDFGGLGTRTTSSVNHATG